jgi:hypothetical protein
MTLIDECTRECLAIGVARHISASGLIETSPNQGSNLHVFNGAD